MCEQTAEGVLSSRAGAINTDARDVHFGMLRRGSFNPKDAIGKSSVTNILPADIVKFFRTMAGAHAVHLHDDETQFRQLLHSRHRTEHLGRKRALRARVNILDDGILLCGIKIRGPNDDTKDVGHSVTRIGYETFWRTPAGFHQFIHVRRFQLRYQLAVL